MIEIRHLRIARRGHGRELVNVERLRFCPNEIHVLIGRTGAGKSLIATAMSGLNIPNVTISAAVAKDDGSVAPLDAVRPLWRRDVFLLPQEPAAALDPTMSIGGQIGEVVRWRRCARAGADLQSAARQVGLSDDDLRKLPHACSGGMLQRVLIAMALVVDASLIVCDEPTKGLDGTRRAEICALLVQLKQAGRMLFVITHDLALAREIGDKLTVLDGGRVVEHGAAASLLAAPASEALSTLVRSEPDRWPSGRRAMISGVPLAAADRVGHRIGKRQLFKGVNLAIHAGEIVGLYGQSGIGKTTLADILLGLTVPTEGEVRWRGSPLAALSAGERRARRVDYLKLFQDPTATFPSWLSAGTVIEKLTPWRNENYSGREGLFALLDRLGLERGVLSRRPGALSGGEMQRLAIARTVLAKPAFLVCDEPSSRLDMVVQKDVVELLADFSRQMMTGLLLITHDERILDRVSDRSFELKRQGEFQAVGKTA